VTGDWLTGKLLPHMGWVRVARLRSPSGEVEKGGKGLVNVKRDA